MLNRPLLSSKQVILKIVRDLDMGDKAIPWQDFIEWIAEAMQHIGAYAQYVEKEADIEIDNYQGSLPCDFYAAKANAIKHKIQGDSILCELEKGYLTKFRYLAMPLDDEGFPLIPDHVSYTTALFWKVAMQLSIQGKLPNKELSYAVCRSRWNWYCLQAGSYGGGFTPATLDRYQKRFHSLLPILQQAERGFAGTDNTLKLGN